MLDFIQLGPNKEYDLEIFELINYVLQKRHVFFFYSSFMDFIFLAGKSVSVVYVEKKAVLQ